MVVVGKRGNFRALCCNSFRTANGLKRTSSFWQQHGEQCADQHDGGQGGQEQLPVEHGHEGDGADEGDRSVRELHDCRTGG